MHLSRVSVALRLYRSGIITKDSTRLGAGQLVDGTWVDTKCNTSETLIVVRRILSYGWFVDEKDKQRFPSKDFA